MRVPDIFIVGNRANEGYAGPIFFDKPSYAITFGWLIIYLANRLPVACEIMIVPLDID